MVVDGKGSAAAGHMDDAAAWKVVTDHMQHIVGMSRGFHARRWGGRLAVDAEDFAQSVCLAVFRRIKTFDGTRGSIGAWVTQITRSELWNSLESAMRPFRRRTTLSAATRVRDDASRGAEAAWDSECVERFIGRLPQQLADVARLAFIEGMNDREVATALGVRRHVAEKRRHKAGRAVAEAMALDGMAGGVVWVKDFSLPKRVTLTPGMLHGRRKAVRDDAGNTWCSALEAAKAVGLHPSAITLAARTGTTSAGRRWNYVGAAEVAA